MPGRDALEAAMRRAFELAALSPKGNPNPQVGCVIVDPEGRSVAEGWHRGVGSPHAEVEALAKLPADWRGRERELTAVVTLEPCNHTGHTGPCSVALSDARIGSVVFSVQDPGVQSAGGTETLRRAGVEVIGGVLEAEGLALLAPWLTTQAAKVPDVGESTRYGDATTGALTDTVHAHEGLHTQSASRSNSERRPHVTVKWAQTLDGRAAAADGSSQWITGEDARADVHRRRAEADAILVGTGTLYADDPALTARAETGGLLVSETEQPVPVVLGRREIPAAARINQHPRLGARRAHGDRGGHGSHGSHGSHGDAPEGDAPEFDAPLHYPGDDLAAHLADLHDRGVRRLFVEGGPTIASAFLRAGLVDEVLVYVAPALLGGPRLALGDLGIESMAGMRRLHMTHFTQLGEDLLIQASIQENEEGH